jgi:hypothetical protein
LSGSSATFDSLDRRRRNNFVERLLGRASVIASISLSACTGLPPLMLGGDPSAVAPHGPQVAALVAHLKCEMSDAVNSTEKLPFYADVPALTSKNNSAADSARQFTLQNLFKEIQYIAEATWTLDVTQTGAATPSASFFRYYRAAAGVLPPTNAVLSVGGQLSEAAHRYLTFNTSVDFARLLPTERAPFEAITSPVTPLTKEQRPPCTSGSELEGDLGLKETLATSLIALAMNNVSAITELEAPAPGTIGGGISLGPIPVQSTYSFGVFSTQVDFTIIEGVNGGPNWNLAYFKGPSSGSSSLLNFMRQV